MNNPWMKFYPQDWQGDEGLQMASLAARGLWIEMLCIMHKNDGFLSVGNRHVTDTQLAIKVGVSAEQVSEIISELESLGVFSRNRAGVIFSRRMLSDMKKSNIAKNNGKNGGNPTLRKQREIPALVNQQDNQPLIQPKIPDTRNQIDTNVSLSLNRERKHKPDFEEFWKLYPRKVGKKDAEKKYWVARKEKTAEEILVALKAHVKATKDKEVEFIPHPATWLHQGRYEDENSVVIIEQEKSSWPKWKQEIAIRFGDHVAKSWFGTAERRGSVLSFTRKYDYEYVIRTYALELKKMGITEIKQGEA